MLDELRVENLLLIEQADLRFGAGLNVITGETGAGKTVLTHALDLLLGGKPRPGIVRPGADEAYVEGLFVIPANLADGLSADFELDGDEVILARRVRSDGRTRAYINRRAATAADLRDVGGRLLSFYGQHEHRKLMLSSSQLEILDTFCGTHQIERLGRVEEFYRAARAIERELTELEDGLGNRERELELLGWELEEIDSLAPSPDEEDSLQVERDRLRHSDLLLQSAGVAISALAPEEGIGANAGLSRASESLSAVAEIDSELGGLSARLDAIRIESEDIASALGGYLHELDLQPGRLEEVEERLGDLDRLKRRFGGTIANVLEHAQRSRERLEQLGDGDASLDQLRRRVQEAQANLSKAADELTAARSSAASALSTEVRKRLEGLALAGARFEVSLARRSEIGPRGADEIEFEIAANPGVPLAPLRDVASGGELSRIMLALMSVAAGAGSQTLIFDEIDAGIGGHTANAVGEQLSILAEDKQLICITHLPQIAALANRHFTITKDTDQPTARTNVMQLDSDELVSEIVRMLGASSEDARAVEHAKALLTPKLSGVLVSVDDHQ